MGLVWWRLEMAAPAELEESLLWKLPLLGVPRVALQHPPEAPERRQLLAWLPESDWPADQRLELERALAPLGQPFNLALPPIRWHRQDDEDWSLSWKSHWQPDPVGKRLLVLPAWLDVPPEQAGRLVIRIDPGSAFGTGSHPTTRLCLEALEALAGERELAGLGPGLRGLRVADLGCGSGILGLAALRLGAATVAAADTDPLAERATRENAALNGLDGAQALTVTTGSAEALSELLEGRGADLLLCNILAPVIEALIPCFPRLLGPGGVGLLSGLLVDQAPGLERDLRAAGWKVEQRVEQDRWGLLRIRSASDVA
ncbi:MULTISPECIES: 50S ribosomal protein L11 methyltransferase [unclassified Cyanobium]|uniref:50S ribosomal protein L11 methyltransferase n=1 Tax=unclassified Cyanobium TaxID=2627006 RepID=UPI0020CD3065|nr:MULTISPECIES: 50S ribosomal protein L11 methyltransferase [unclassified Cyanobium]MCP9833480.1 50S ribosomal protein L11 methyltransferase [Cyanobium sp. La Preciosa 7G6]MCP9936245.1 50S ribosomal protein L11 methyltransferase [Cyanobium sp. Aljojuca 7A6]